MPRFDLEFPLWYLRNIKARILAGGPFVLGEYAVLLFSNQYLAENYAARHAEAPSIVVAESVDRDHFLGFLDEAEQGGFTHVFVDFGPQPRFYGSIREVRASFEGQGDG